MKILIYEKNEKDAEEIKSYLEILLKQKNIENEISVCINSVVLLKKSNLFDLVFLNIDFDFEKGNDIGYELRKINEKIKIIVLSAHSKYLFDGYKIHPERYFLKPINQNVFIKEMENVINQCFQFNQEIDDKKISNSRIYLKDILYVDYFNRKTRLHCLHDVVLETPYNMKYWIDYFNCSNNSTFIQIHRAFLINLENIKQLEKNEILLINEERLQLTRSFKVDFKEKYIRYFNDL